MFEWCKSGWDYNISQMGNSFQCFNVMYSDDLRNIFSMQGMQIRVIEIIGPIGLVFCVINTLMIMMIKSLNEPPSDILLFISLQTALKIVLYFATIIYNGIHPLSAPTPDNFDDFCLVTGTIDTFCELSKVIATIIFCFYYVNKIKNPLKAWIEQHKEIYIVSFFLITTATCIVYFTHNIGISIYGYCSIKFSQFAQFISLIFALAFMLTLLISSIIFLKYLQKVSTNDLTFRKYFKYYFKYLIIFSCDQLLIIFSHTVITFACILNISQNVFNICLVIDKIAIVLNPIFIFVVLVNHPRFKKVMLIKVIKTISKKWNLITHLSRRDSSTGYVDEDIIMSTNRNTVLIQLNNLSGIDSGYISQLKNKNRACFLATILGCLVVDEMQYQEMMERQSALVDLEQRQSQININPMLNYHSQYNFLLKQNIIDHYHEVFLHKLPVITISFTSYCSAVFQMLKKMDNIDNFKALTPELNQKQIIKDANNDGDGGRSGQFFFFNHDRSFILKTLSEKQKGILLSRLQAFFHHFISQSQSFIVKVYSLFTTKNVSTEQECHFMLMGNILRSINRQYVIKVYDLKGSSHHREVLKDSSHCNDEVVVSTLKDLDFIKIEGKVWLSQADSRQVKSILTSDASFLCENRLIDYSLLVIKINLRGLLDEDSEQDMAALRYYKSTKEPKVAYVFGVIDYLETWNIIKKSEKWYKSLFAKASTISSQDPKFYFQRFTKHVINDFFP